MKKKFKVLIACEFSGVVREAFNAYHGIHAVSCDLLPPEDGRVDYHYQGSVLDILDDGWDMMIAFPPCTFLSNSGVKHLYIDGKKANGICKPRWKEMRKGAKFFNTLLHADIPLVAVENPIQHAHARKLIVKYDQIIQPWQFGHGESKATCLWLRNLPDLLPTNEVEGREQRVWKESPGPNRWMERSRTLPGIGQAMADQWVPILLNSLTKA